MVAGGGVGGIGGGRGVAGMGGDESLALAIETTQDTAPVAAATAAMGEGEEGIPLAPPEAFFRGIIRALVQRDDSERAAAMVREMAVMEGCSPSPADFNRVIKSCGAVGRWEEAVALLREMGSAGVPSNAISYEGKWGKGWRAAGAGGYSFVACLGHLTRFPSEMEKGIRRGAFGSGRGRG